MKKYIKYVILLCCLIMATVISICVFKNDEMIADSAIYEFTSSYLINESITPYVKFITMFGGFAVLVSITILVLIFVKNKKIGLSILINLILISLFNFLLKFIWMRPRPNVNALIFEDGYSYPSGHSAVSLAFYGYLIYIIYTRVKDKKIKWLLIGILSLIILLVGMSRIYLGVHYASDVISGFCFSMCYLFLYIEITKKFM